MKRLLVFSLVLAGVANTSPQVMLASSYIETAELSSLIRKFQRGTSFALCSDKLTAEKPKVKVTQCASKRCPADGCEKDCNPKTEAWREISVESSCSPKAFLLGFENLKAGPIPKAEYQFDGKGFAVRFQDREFKILPPLRKGKKNSSTGTIVITEKDKPSREVFRTDATEFFCGLNWAGDLNADRELDFIVDCTVNTYQQVKGLFLSSSNASNGYEFIKQSAVGGNI